MEGKTFTTIEEAQTFLDAYMRRHNNALLDEFHGLSPEQMSCVLDFPFDSPELAAFSTLLDTPPSAPIIMLFQLLADAIGEDRLKPTTTGNLPRKLLRESALTYWGEEEYRKYTEIGNINTETDFFEMHVTRLVAELAGLVRKYKGKFILSRDCRKVLKEQGTAGIYPRLLRAYAERFNWSYRDMLPEVDFIRQSFLFTLYLLHLYGGEWKTNTFYEDAFLQAFPVVLKNVPESPYWTQEDSVREAYSGRALKGFAQFFGLIEIETESGDRYDARFKVRALPLLEKVVAFHAGRITR